MLTRNQQRAKAKAKRVAREAATIEAALRHDKAIRNQRNAAIVKANRTRSLSDDERFGKIRSCMADMASQSHRGYVCTNIKRPSMEGRDK